MEVLIKPLYAITSVGLEDNLIDVVVMRAILQKAQEQQEIRLQNLEALSHFENIIDFDDQIGFDNWNNFRNAA
ncbi:MAG: hypothetical protein P4L53_26185 [Candidatus Obscuribacterales bacterium]|nr:hypothetical protein [Candidatus Obscuribacterales bacterium]